MFCRDVTQRRRHAVCTAKEEERENRERQRVDDWLMKTVSKMGSGLIGSKTKTNVPSLFTELRTWENWWMKRKKRGLLTINTNSAHICWQEHCILVEVLKTLLYFPSIKKKKLLSCGRERTKTSLRWLCWNVIKKKKKVLDSGHTIVFVSTYFQSYKIFSPYSQKAICVSVNRCLLKPLRQDIAG